jgi:hypothetical protein
MEERIRELFATWVAVALVVTAVIAIYALVT